jgi:hypothetical protein
MKRTLIFCCLWAVTAHNPARAVADESQPRAVIKV